MIVAQQDKECLEDWVLQLIIYKSALCNQIRVYLIIRDKLTFFEIEVFNLFWL